jgi:hypothetical protein
VFIERPDHKTTLTSFGLGLDFSLITKKYYTFILPDEQ